MQIEIPATFKQRKFIEAVVVDKFYEQIGFGGARGGGKTFTSCAAMTIRRLQYEGTRGLMLRRVQASADQNLGEEIRKVCRLMGLPTGDGGAARWLESKKQWIFCNGSYIQIGYCRSPDDWEKYQGTEYADIAFEEATQFTEKAWRDIGGSNRSNNPRCTPKRWATTNPGGRGSAWVQKEFGVSDPKTLAPRTLWIPAYLRESTALLETDPGYRDRVLSRQPEWRRKQWEDGDWDAMEGQFFQIDPRMFRGQDVPDWADVYCGADAGYWPAAFAVVWFAVWEDGDGKLRVHIMRELKVHKRNLYQQSEEALDMEKVGLPNHRVKSRFADPSAWKRSEGNDGMSMSTALSWSDHGFTVSPALTNARAAGWLLMRTLMDAKQLTIDPCCRSLRKEMEDAVHDDKSDDIAQGQDVEDHCLDALRYGLVSTVFGFAPKPTKKDYDERSTKRFKRKGKVTEIK